MVLYFFYLDTTKERDVEFGRVGVLSFLKGAYIDNQVLDYDDI